MGTDMGLQGSNTYLADLWTATCSTAEAAEITVCDKQEVS